MRGINRTEKRENGGNARRRWKRDDTAEEKRNKTTRAQGHGFPSMLGFREPPRRSGHSKAGGRGPGPGGSGVRRARWRTLRSFRGDRARSTVNKSGLGPLPPPLQPFRPAISLSSRERSLQSLPQSFLWCLWTKGQPPRP